MRVKFEAVCKVSDRILARNRAYSGSLGLPDFREFRRAAGPLAVVGGGPSIADHADTLKRWPGDVWAINGAFQWCIRNGIDAVFYSIEPGRHLARHAQGAGRAIVADVCNPRTFRVLRGRDAYRAPISEIGHGSTTACTAPLLAAHAGYEKVVLFGCESSFGEDSHAYPEGVPDKNRLKVRCDEWEYLTTPQFFMQAEYLADILRALPDYLSEQSGGLLRAAVRDREIDVVAASRELADRIMNEKAEKAA